MYGDRVDNLKMDELRQNKSSTRSVRRVPRIEIAGMGKWYGQKEILHDINLVIEPGQFFVLLGPSGSGKSTLLRCLAGIERPSKGSIRFGVRTIEGPGCHIPPERRNLAMVFQDYALWPHLSAEQNVAFALERTGLTSVERLAKARRILNQMGLGKATKRYPGQLSGGEQQRVGLARALVADPEVLLFDEPLSNLDADRREKLRVDIGVMVRQQGASAVYITHDQAEAFALADVIGVLNSGRLVQVGSPEEIYRRPANEFVARFTGLAGELSGKVKGFGVGDMSTFADILVGGQLVKGRPIGKRELKVGERVRILIRPSSLTFVDSNSNDMNLGMNLSRFELIESMPKIEVSVFESAFRGWGYEHTVMAGGDFQLSGIRAERRIPFMSRAMLALSPDGCLVIPENENVGGMRGPSLDSFETKTSSRNEFETLG